MRGWFENEVDLVGLDWIEYSSMRILGCEDYVERIWGFCILFLFFCLFTRWIGAWMGS